MKPKKLFPYLFLFLLIHSVAAQEDFTATTLPEVELCPCSNQAYAVTVKNTGSISSTYSLLAAGEAAKWVTFSPRNFVLNPGQAGSFFVFANSFSLTQILATVSRPSSTSSRRLFFRKSSGKSKVLRNIHGLSLT